MLVGLVFLVLLAIHLDVVRTTAASREGLVAAATASLGNIRDSYTQSSFAAWAGEWADVIDRLQGEGPLRIYQRPVVIPLNRDLVNYPFDSPACRAFSTAERGDVLACALYNAESRRLQVVVAWHETDWAVAREGDADPAKADRIAFRIPALFDDEIYVAPQVSLRNRALLEACFKVWRSPELDKRCDTQPMALYRVRPNRLLGAPVPGANGLAIRTNQCPSGVPTPCVKAQFNLLVRPPKSAAVVCLAFRDASERLALSSVVVQTCSTVGHAPLNGKFVESASSFPLDVEQQAVCAPGALCLCQTPSLDDPGCIGVAPQNAVQRPSVSVAGWARSISRLVIAASGKVRGVAPADASAAFLSSRTSRPIAYLVRRIDSNAIEHEALTLLAPRLSLYLAALLGPMILFVLARVAIRNGVRRTSEVARLRQVERDLNAARAHGALARAALEGATSNLELLGHEIMSPAQSLLHILDRLQGQARGQPFEAALKDSFLDHAEEYVGRMTKAAEHVRDGLQMQRRHAESQAAQRSIELGEFLRRRIDNEQTLASFHVRFENLAPGVRILADRGDLERVLANLMSNARRYAGASPVTITLRAQDQAVVLTIRNEGPVITGDDGDIFALGVSSSREREDGASHGYGLFIARMAMSAMGGTITYENDLPPATHGVVFALTFPVAQSLAASDR